MKKTALFKTLFYSITLIAFLMQLVMPTTVFADGDTPPAEPVPTETPVDPAVPPLPDFPVEPVIPPAEVIASGTDLVVVDQSGEILPLGTVAAAEAIFAGDPIWCPNTVTSVIALSSGCSSNFTNLLDALTFADTQSVDGTIWIASGSVFAVDAVSDSGLTFTSNKTYSLTLQGGWDTNVTDVTNPLIITSPSIFNQVLNITWGGNLNVYNMTLNGVAAGNTEALLNLTSTGGNIVMSDVEVSNAQGGGEIVDANSVVSFTPGTEGYGAKVTTNTGTVSVSDSTFKDNNHHGLYVVSNGAVTLNNILATGNGGQRDLTAGEVTAVQNAHSPESNWDWNINDYIDYGTYDRHVWWGSGAWVNASTGGVQVANSNFGNGTLAGANNGSGLVVNAASGNITLNGVTSDFNHGDGAILDAQSGNVQTTNSTFINSQLYTMDNGSTLKGWYDNAWESDFSDWAWRDILAGGSGLLASASGDITLNTIHAGTAGNANQYSGAGLYSDNGQISVTDSEFSNNGMNGSIYGGGLFAESGYDWSTNSFTCLVSGGCDITLTNVDVSGNQGSGAYLGAYSGGVTVQGTSHFSQNGKTGLYVETGHWFKGCPAGAVCDITVSNVEVMSNDSYGADLNSSDGSVSVTDSVFSLNTSDGLYAWTDLGNIVVTNVTAAQNDYGAYLGNSYGGTITVSNSTFNLNSSDGIYAETSTDRCDNGPCNVTLTNIIANNNGSYGAELYTDYGGTITVNGGTFNGNSDDGLYAKTAWYDCMPGMVCDVTVNGVTAQNNGWEGANLNTEMGGKITVNGGTYSGNAYEGLTAEINEDNLTDISGTVIFNSVTSTGNGLDGAGIYLFQNGGIVKVTGSTFSENGLNGLYMTGNRIGTGAITEIMLEGISAHQNAARGFFYDGPVPVLSNVAPRAQNQIPANILICSSVFDGNTSYGIYIVNDGGQAEVGQDVVSSGNNLLGIDGLENLILSTEVTGNCVKVPARQIFHGSEIPNTFSCGNNELPLVVMLPNTDWVRIPCSTAKVANVYALPKGSLAHIPGTFISALSFTIQNAIGADATIGFKIPDGVAVERLTIVHWDPATQSWITIGGLEDGSGYFVAQVDEGGIYALVQR